jgi:small subunit ribosomal protein S16
MLIVRLKPFGKKRNRVYRLVAAQKHIHVSKKTVEDLGSYDPKTKVLKVNKERLSYYQNLNVEFSDTAKAICKKHLAVA